MIVGKIVKNVGYGLVSLGVEEVVLACIDATLPSRRAHGTMKVLQNVGKHAISMTAATKVTKSIQETVDEYTGNLRGTMKPEKKVQP